MRRILAALLPAVLLPLLTPGTAYAAGTFRNDDGTADAEIHVDWSDGQDQAWTWLNLPNGQARGSTGATLWVYGRAAECDAPGTQRLVMNAGTVATFDPCATFPTTGYAWHAFTVPMAYLDRGYNWFGIVDDSGPLSGSNAYYAIDASTGGYSIQRDSTGEHDITGLPMWYLDLTGSVPHLNVQVYEPDFGTVSPGGSSAEHGVTIVNDGLEPLTPTITLSSPEFAVTTDNCTGGTFATNGACGFRLVFQPTSPGTKTATLTVTAPGAAGSPWSITLYGEGTAAPPVSTIATRDGAVLLPGGTVSGSVTSVSWMAHEYVEFVPDVPGLATRRIDASLSCDPARTACSWTANPYLLALNDPTRLPLGAYSVRAYGVDRQGNVESPGPAIRVTMA